MCSNIHFCCNNFNNGSTKGEILSQTCTIIFDAHLLIHPNFATSDSITHLLVLLVHQQTVGVPYDTPFPNPNTVTLQYDVVPGMLPRIP